MIEVSKEKDSIRKKILAKLANTPESYFEKAGKITQTHLSEWLSTIAASKKICIFKSITREIETKPIIDFLKEIKINYSIISPLGTLDCTINDCDIVFLPGLGFDKNGCRLGRGKGFFDKLLAHVNNKKPILVGLTTDLQILEYIPTEPHDIKMDYICTPNLGFIKAGKKNL